MKKIIRILFAITVTAAFLCGCGHLPDGYAAKQHTYDEALEYVKFLDENATVDETYQDTEQAPKTYRIWPAVISGEKCSIASVGTPMRVSRIFSTEKMGYTLETDYDTCVLKKLITNYPELGKVKDSDLVRFDSYNVFSEIKLTSATEEELKSLWEQYRKLNDEYNEYLTGKTYYLVMKYNNRRYFFTDEIENEYHEVYEEIQNDAKIK